MPINALLARKASQLGRRFAPILKCRVICGLDHRQRQGRIAPRSSHLHRIVAQRVDRPDIAHHLRHLRNGSHDRALELLGFHLMPRPEIERYDHPQQPPQRLWHQCDPLHTGRKPDRVDHGRHE